MPREVAGLPSGALSLSFGSPMDDQMSVTALEGEIISSADEDVVPCSGQVPQLGSQGGWDQVVTATRAWPFKVGRLVPLGGSSCTAALCPGAFLPFLYCPNQSRISSPLTTLQGGEDKGYTAVP